MRAGRPRRSPRADPTRRRSERQPRPGQPRNAPSHTTIPTRRPGAVAVAVPPCAAAEGGPTDPNPRRKPVSWRRRHGPGPARPNPNGPPPPARPPRPLRATHASSTSPWCRSVAVRRAPPPKVAPPIRTREERRSRGGGATAPGRRGRTPNGPPRPPRDRRRSERLTPPARRPGAVRRRRAPPPKVAPPTRTREEAGLVAAAPRPPGWRGRTRTALHPRATTDAPSDPRLHARRPGAVRRAPSPEGPRAGPAEPERPSAPRATTAAPSDSRLQHVALVPFGRRAPCAAAEGGPTHPNPRRTPVSWRRRHGPGPARPNPTPLPFRTSAQTRPTKERTEPHHDPHEPPWRRCRRRSAVRRRCKRQGADRSRPLRSLSRLGRGLPYFAEATSSPASRYSARSWQRSKMAVSSS
jgi:hypothetical protein